MKYYKCNFMLSFIGLMLSLSSALAYAYPLSNQPHTPPLSLEPGSLSSDSSYDIAKVFWLPDYQTSMNGRTENPDKPGGGDLPIGKKTCSTYGFQDSFDSTRYLCDIKRPKPGMTCYTNCKCKPTVIPGVGEECDITCGSACVKSKCKPAVTFTNPNDRCTQKCTQDQNVCTAKTCDSKCASGTSLTCTGPVSGTDGCGQSCKKCCEEACPSGTTETNPGGCGGSTQNGCGTKTCYNAYKACCDDSGSYSCSSNYYSFAYTNGCGNTRYNCYSAYCSYVITEGEYCWHVTTGYTIASASARKDCRRPDGSTYTISSAASFGRVPNTSAYLSKEECERRIANGNPYRPGEVVYSSYQ